MDLLTEANAEPYLRQKGWVADDERLVVRRLTGGVSNEVLYVARPDRAGVDFVLKQARSQLRTPEPWYSSVERIWREVDVLRICQRLLGADSHPEAVASDTPVAATPHVLHEDRDNYAFAMSAAPVDHRVWKADLLAGRVEPGIAAACGRLLGRLHAGSWHDPRVAAELDDRQLFDELRLDPYYRFVARRYPGDAPAIERLIDETWRERHCLVHADFSPKNLLVYGVDRHPTDANTSALGPGESSTSASGLLLVDFETGHYGDPAFDLGFFLSHLVLKAAYHAPAHEVFLALTSEFWRHYLAQLQNTVSSSDLERLEHRAVANFAGCAWARLDGKSQIDYLTDPHRRGIVRGLCQELLRQPAQTWQSVLDKVRRRFA
ncbi:MAG TPA: phosphotransferase [Pirellulales bacterium]|nr:phosphotransferase [Pirellulales bacterium]